MARVTGIGGLFFRSANNKALGEWYEKYFGITYMPRKDVWRQDAGPTVFSPFKHDTDYFGIPGQQFMVNLRVEGIDELLDIMKADGVKIDKNRVEDAIGKFAWVFDPEGNKIELWEPSEETK
ncbi:glyoxalase [Flavobacterium cyanobacteriorum]|uniref:Glyoxalase n=1 Tax=Flavobacterium cyanobacteriorum TaxID=2022802 RepID=A0A255Z9X2_9FLAO|nr:VOC family protein [Flavobacterium cyanobacteriorum]OYQ38363.1 glyoxalase [Flavobacterium cyanobacteriorum]